MNYPHKQFIKFKISDYLKVEYGIHKNRFKCISGTHEDKNPSMYLSKRYTAYCNTCQANYDIYNLVQNDKGINTFKEQYEYLCNYFSLDDDFNKNIYKKNMKNIKNNYQKQKTDLEKMQLRYNKFWDKLVNKKRDLENVIKLLDSNDIAYQDLQFKIEFINKFLNSILECNIESINKIKNFNKLFELEYEQFNKTTLILTEDIENLKKVWEMTKYE
jgi:hypothetical protein